MSGYLINNIDGIQTYNLGDTIELMFQTDTVTANIIGQTISVNICDIWDNPIGSCIAERLGDIYVTEYKIPFNVSSYYNANSEPESNTNFFFIKDIWQLSAPLEFGFLVNRALDQPTEDNCILNVALGSIEALDGSIFDEATISFTTKLIPFYCTVADVIDIYPEYLGKTDVFDIVANIMQYSLNVDYHMRPDVITYTDRYNNAVRNFVAYDVAESILSSTILNVSKETKELDTLKISRDYSHSSGILKQINDAIRRFGDIVLAGGEDTPFKTRRFVKGIFDPNRTQANRLHLDTSGYLPYINATTKNLVIHTVDGDNIEIRGTRTISHCNLIH